MANELPFDRRTPDAVFEAGTESVCLLSRESDVNRLESELVDPDVERWARDARFGERVVVAVHVGSSGESTPLEVRGVERTGEAVQASTCIERRGATDDWVPYAALLRVPFDPPRPSTASLTHREAGETRVFE